MPDISVIPLPVSARFSFRGRPGAVAAAGTAFGVRLPQEACRAATDGARAALWLGPDEWLLLAPEDQASEISLALPQAMTGLPHALADVSQAFLAFEIAGKDAATVLSGGCPLDLDPAGFPVGMCTRTVLGKAAIVLWRFAPERFRLECGRSFAGYVAELLEQSRADWAA